MQNRKKQQGISMTALAVLVVLIATVALVFIKVVPIYMENAKIRSVMDIVVEDSQSTEMTISDVKAAIRKRFRVENVDYVKAEDFEIARASSGISLYIDYEVRTPLFANIDLVISFEEQSGEE